MEHIQQCLMMLDRAARWRLGQIGALVLFNTLLEVATVGMILPFIALLNNPALVETHPAVERIYKFLGMGSPTSFLEFIGISLFALVLFKNIYLYWLTRLQSRFGYCESARIAVKLFARYLTAPLQTHLNRNSADMITTVDYSVDAVFSQVLLYVLVFITEASIVLALILFMLFAEPKLTLMLGLVLGGCAVLLGVLLQRELVLLGQVGIKLRIARLQTLQQALTSIKEVKVLGRESYFLKAFNGLRQRHAANQARSATLSQMPRQVLEVVVVGGLLLVIVAILLQGRASADIIAVLGLFAMAAFRIMPALNRMVNAYNTIKNGQAAVEEVWADYSNPNLAEALPPANALPVSFVNDLQLCDVSFTYEASTARVIDNVSLRVRRGESIGFVGPSGAGKSTLIDIVLGLLAPQQGRTLVDGIDIAVDLRGWQRLIGYVPQTISLVDDTLRNNVAFGIEPDQIDESRVWRVLAMARLDEFCRTLPEGLDTGLGERGVRLSGGQRQRVGIARALYHDPQVLIFDEATSALDSESERDITETIEAMRGDKTVLIIAHRLSTVKRCDRLVLLRNGAIADTGTFDELMSRRADFREMVQLAELVARTPEIASALH